MNFWGNFKIYPLVTTHTYWTQTHVGTPSRTSFYDQICNSVLVVFHILTSSLPHNRYYITKIQEEPSSPRILDCGFYKYWELLTKTKTNSVFKGVYIFQVFMAIHNRKFGHIAPLQNKLNINPLSPFDMENIQGGF